MRDDKTYIASDPKVVADAEEKAKLEQDQRLADLKEVLNTPAGIRVISKVLEDGGLFRTSFTGNSKTFFNEGMRNLALKLFSEITDAAPDKLESLILKVKGA